MIPEWNANGMLPAGVHPATWAEMETRLGWNPRRRSLLLGLTDSMEALRIAGCKRLWLDGSFVTDKETPSDYDACWDPDGVDRLLLDPALLDYSATGRAAIKSRYQGDLLIAGVEKKTGLTFVEFFQRSRDGKPKGIILLNPQEIQ